jgi:hypothetical protein
MAAAEHGSLARYHGSKTREPCRCDVCRRGWAAYMRARRDRNVAERTGTPVAARESTSNVVAMPTMHHQPAAVPDDDLLLEIMAFLDEQGIINRALRARVRKLCSILADNDLRGHWVAASKHLDELLVRVEGPAKRKKSNTGKLAIMNSMNAPRKRTGTT